jgi:serine/threonine protein phosphatase PrpC
VQQGSAWWAHVGDSRIYHIRHGALVARTRDHSHVELLLREGLITVEQVQMHPMRNFVESCLGGDPILPDMSITPRQLIEPGDVLLVCTDGLWGALRDTELSQRLEVPGSTLRDSLAALGQLSLARAGAGSDNTSAAALRWLGD